MGASEMALSRAIDAHVHLATEEWLEGSMGPYQQSVERYFRTTIRPVTVEEMAEAYRRAGVLGILLAWDAERGTGRPPVSNERVAEIVSQYPDAFIGFGSVDPSRPDAIDRVREVSRLGLKGLKLHPTLQGFDPADPALAGYFDAAAEAGLPLLVHTGTSGVGAREPGGQGLRIDWAQPIRLDWVAARYPTMNILLAHVGWPWHHEAMAMALHKTNVYIDISGWKYRYLPEDFVREMKTRLSDQVLFGTDYPMFQLDTQLAEFSQLKLPDDVAEKVLIKNAQRYLRLG